MQDPSKECFFQPGNTSTNIVKKKVETVKYNLTGISTLWRLLVKRHGKFAMLHSCFRFWSSLEGSGWLRNLSLLLRAALCVVTAIARECRLTLVHCSDGWDRTAQVVSLAQLMLDPYYRTFQVCINYTVNSG